MSLNAAPNQDVSVVCYIRLTHCFVCHRKNRLFPNIQDMCNTRRALLHTPFETVLLFVLFFGIMRSLWIEAFAHETRPA
jgi:hypothetical protein